MSRLSNRCLVDPPYKTDRGIETSLSDRYAMKFSTKLIDLIKLFNIYELLTWSLYPYLVVFAALLLLWLRVDRLSCLLCTCVALIGLRSNPFLLGTWWLPVSMLLMSLDGFPWFIYPLDFFFYHLANLIFSSVLVCVSCVWVWSVCKFSFSFFYRWLRSRCWNISSKPLWSLRSFWSVNAFTGRYLRFTDRYSYTCQFLVFNS